MLAMIIPSGDIAPNLHSIIGLTGSTRSAILIKMEEPVYARGAVRPDRRQVAAAERSDAHTAALRPDAKCGSERHVAGGASAAVQPCARAAACDLTQHGFRRHRSARHGRLS